jgi:pimeloyl-ACP methyl ester carboxylesterase
MERVAERLLPRFPSKAEAHRRNAPAIAADRFEEAMSAGLARWPFQRARLLLVYGRWLRRERRVADSRPPLRAAREIFDTLGCAERAYPNLIYYNRVDRGGHFAAWEQPQLFSDELRAAFRSIR